MNQQNQIPFAILALCLLGSAVYITLVLISPPAPLPLEAPAVEFSAGRAMQDLEVIAREPRPMGAFPAHTAVRDFLLGKIRKLGLEPQVQKTFGLRVINPVWTIGGAVENILVRLPGFNPEGAILLIAHYDSTPGGPGAVDNGSGVVTILEILRALQAGPQLHQDLIFLFSDGHEPGIFGTSAFVSQHPWFKEIKRVIILDTIKDGPTVLSKTSLENGSWIEIIAHTTERPTNISMPYDLFPTGEGDLDPFIKAGVPGASFGSGDNSQEVHTSLDRPEIVNPSSVQQTGDQILALVRYLGNQPTIDMGSPDQTYFPVLGRLIHYPTSWAMPLAVLAGLSFLSVLIYGCNKRTLTWKGMGMGFLMVLICLALCLAIVVLLWQGLQAIHPEYQYSSFRPHLSDDYLYAIGFFTLVLAVITSWIPLARKKVTAHNLAAGGLLVWFPATIVAAILVPESSYLGIWVLLPGSLVLLLASAVQSNKYSWILTGMGYLVSAFLATFLWIPVMKSAFLGPGFTMLWMILGVAALWMVALLPALDWITSQRRWPLPIAATLVTLGFLLAGHFLVSRNSPPPLVNSIGYWLDAESRQAYWVAFIGGTRTDTRYTERNQVAFPEKMDERQARLLENPTRLPYTNLSPDAPPFSVLTNEAPLLTQVGPHLDVISDKWGNNCRMVKIRFTTALHDRLYIFVPNAPLLAITVSNIERTELAGVQGVQLRFDGIPAEGMEISFDFSTAGPIQLRLVEEKTGLPSFPGLSTQPEPGTMRSPGEFFQGDATDFTAIYRRIDLPATGGE